MKNLLLSLKILIACMLKRNRKTTIVLIEGAWHTSEAWKDVKFYLRKWGFNAVTPTLPRRAFIDNNEIYTVDDYAISIACRVNGLHYKNVILVGHSSAGSIIQAAMEYIPEDIVKQIIFCNSFVLRHGERQLDRVDAHTRERFIEVAKHNNGLIPPDENYIRNVLMPNNTLSEQQKVIDQLIKEPLALFNELVDTSFYERKKPKAIGFLHLTEDVSMPENFYKDMAINEGGAIATVEFAAGHEAHVVRGRGFAKKLLELIYKLDQIT